MVQFGARVNLRILQEIEARLKHGCRGESRERCGDSSSHWNLLNLLSKTQWNLFSATPNLQNKTHLNLGSKGLWSSQSGINMGVLRVNLKTQKMRSGH